MVKAIKLCDWFGQGSKDVAAIGDPCRSCRRLRSFDFDLLAVSRTAQNQDQKIAAFGSSYGSKFRQVGSLRIKLR
ncbi:hypothetical protein ABH905_004583 [Pseudomonas frederiksbergensis]